MKAATIIAVVITTLLAVPFHMATFGSVEDSIFEIARRLASLRDVSRYSDEYRTLSRLLELLLRLAYWVGSTLIASLLVRKFVTAPIARTVSNWIRSRRFKRQEPKLHLRWHKDGLGFSFSNMQARLNEEEATVTLEWGPQFGPSVCIASPHKGSDEPSSDPKSGKLTAPCCLIAMKESRETYCVSEEYGRKFSTVMVGGTIGTVSTSGQSMLVDRGTGRCRLVVGKYRNIPTSASLISEYTRNWPQNDPIDVVAVFWGCEYSVLHERDAFVQRFNQLAAISQQKAWDEMVSATCHKAADSAGIQLSDPKVRSFVRAKKGVLIDFIAIDPSGICLVQAGSSSTPSVFTAKDAAPRIEANALVIQVNDPAYEAREARPRVIICLKDESLECKMEWHDRLIYQAQRKASTTLADLKGCSQ